MTWPASTASERWAVGVHSVPCQRTRSLVRREGAGERRAAATAASYDDANVLYVKTFSLRRMTRYVPSRESCSMRRPTGRGGDGGLRF